jgi:hypothetical protein
LGAAYTFAEKWLAGVESEMRLDEEDSFEEDVSVAFTLGVKPENNMVASVKV